MFRFGRKAQGSMEYIMTYGWAILVVMIVGITMWRLGVFEMGGSVGLSMQGFGAVKPQLAATGYDSTGVFTGLFLNAAGSRIKVTGISVEDGFGNNMTCSPEEGYDCCTEPEGLEAGVTVQTNSHIKIVTDPSACSLEPSMGEPGEPYQLKVSIYYTTNVRGEELAHTSSGTIRGSIE
ncbi:MAG TPA: hypothetical protein ENN13_03405 [Candidatus Altiarchaeales archaeon]|nr:hypothetical protein [Candidatus Altiarchaeales archaeon]